MFDFGVMILLDTQFRLNMMYTLSTLKKIIERKCTKFNLCNFLALTINVLF